MRLALASLILFTQSALGGYDLRLEGNENVIVTADRRISKTGGGDEWNGTFHSLDLLPQELSVSSWLVGPQELREAVIFGLTPDPLSGVWEAIEFGILYDHNSYQVFTDGGGWVGPDMPCSRGDLFAINYKGGKVSFFHNHVKIHEIEVGHGRRFYLDGSIAYLLNECMVYAKEI